MSTSMLRFALPLASTLLFPASLCVAAPRQAVTGQATAAPRQSGTVKAVTPGDFVLTLASGQDVAVTLPATVRVLLVDPVTRDIKAAQAGTVADIAGGDKAIVTGTAGDTGQTMTATRVYLLKSGAIAAMHASEQAEWARSVGGIVKSVDASAGTLAVANGARTYTISTSPTTLVRRYAAGSVRFEDAVKSSVGAIQPGDQVQVRGQRSPEGTTVTAEEIVAGSFSNFSGVLTSVNAAAGTVTLTDLATKKAVTVTVTPQTNIRKLPAGFAQGMGAREGAAGQGSGGARPGAGAAGSPSGATGGARRLDLSRVMSRLPTETTADLKQGDAVMIVASNGNGSAEPTAISLLSGVEGILASSPAGQTTLSPWSLGGGGGAEAEGGEGSAGAGPSTH